MDRLLHGQSKGRLALAVVSGWLFAVLTLTCGCSSQPGVIFDPAEGVHQWPPASDEARIRYVGQLKSQDDLKPGRNWNDQVGETLFGKEPGQAMVSPMAVCTDGGERVFIVDVYCRVVHVLDLGSRLYQRWAPTAEQGGFEQPVALAYDASGRLVVSDSAAGDLVVFDASGKCVRRIGKGKLRRPCGVVVDPVSGRIMVADAGAHQIVVMNFEGDELGRIGERGSALGQFNFPTNVALDSRGQLYVSDTLNFRVQVLGRDFAPIRQIGRKGDMPGYFSQPKGIALDAEDHLYVVDANFEAVQLFDSEGRLLMSLGREGQEPGEFWLPAGICVDKHGRIWVADSYNRRVQVFDYLPEAKKP